jgi:hypothetical protein
MADEQLKLGIAAEITGMAAFDQAAAGINQVNGATQGLNDTQKKLRKETEEAAKQIRIQRMATTQLGMQISQVSTQMSSGTSVGQIFAQQIGDIGYAMSGMEGKMGAVGKFLTGPWGVALSIAGMALVPLIERLFETKQAAEETKTAFAKLVGSMSGASLLSDVFTENFKVIAETKGKVAQLNVELLKLSTAPVQFKGEAAYAAATAASKSRIKAIKAEIIAGNQLIAQKADEIEQAKSFAKIREIQDRNNAVLQGENAASKTGAVSSPRRSGTSSRLNDDKKDVDDFTKFVNDSIADTMKNLDDYSKAYASTTSDNLKMAVQAFDEQRSYEEKIKDYALSKDQERATKVIDAYNAVGNAVADSFKGMITGAQSFGDAFKNIIGSVIDELFRLYVVQQIVGMVKGALGSVFGVPSMTGKAIGGSVQSGQPYMVGERGPEMFVPSRGGSIVPNNQMSGAMVVNVDARGASDPAAVRQQVELGIAQAAPYIIAAAQNRTLKSASRTRLPGTIG